MNDPKREHLPLLCDDLSDEEYHIENSSTPYKRRLSSNRSRSKYHVRGAAAIIKHWPDHISSLLTYWWMGLAMIGLTVFIIYNSVVAIAIIPPNSRLTSMQSSGIEDNYIEEFDEHKMIYMHVITNDHLSADLSEYIPYVEIISKTFPTYKYNFVILYNDTLENIDDTMSDFQKNKFALNSVLKDTKYINKVAHGKNIFIEHKSLTAFMNESPLKKYWRHLPEKFVWFLIRCIAIWNKGGISVNPILFTPKSPNPHYLEKIKNILKDIEEPKFVTMKKYYPKTRKIKKKVNNIRDIIENLENTSNSIENKTMVVNLVEVETRNVPLNINNTQVPPMKNIPDKNSSGLKNKYIKKNITPKNITDHGKYNKLNTRDVTSLTMGYKNGIENNSIARTNEAIKQNIFPMFLKYLFSPTMDGNLANKSDNDDTFVNNNKIEEENLSKNILDNAESHSNLHVHDLSKEISNNIISAEIDHSFDLTLDLKGNIIVSKIPCHALLGTIFNNVVHHMKDETVTDFIIAELSIFCKGTWTACKGVNVIFL